MILISLCSCSILYQKHMNDIKAYLNTMVKNLNFYNKYNIIQLPSLQLSTSDRLTSPRLLCKDSLIFMLKLQCNQM